MPTCLFALSQRQPDRALSRGSTRCLLLVLLGQFEVSRLRSQGAGQARPRVSLHLSEHGGG